MLNAMRSRWHLIVGQVFRRLGRHQWAAPHFESVIELYPQHLFAHFLLGRSQLQLKQYEKAIFTFDRALQIAPGRAYAHAHKGISCMYLGRYQEAAHGLERAFRIQQKYRTTHRYVEALAQCYFNLGQFESALENYRLAEQLSPRNSESASRLGWTLFKLERFEESELPLRRAILLAASNADACIAWPLPSTRWGGLTKA
jgi:tetratricopeptide (TPR) repeat protein